MLIGYARVSTRLTQDTASQERLLLAAGVAREAIHLDQGFTGKNTDRPGLHAALAALRPGDVLVVTKLDRLARSAQDAFMLAQVVAGKGASLQYGATRLDPADPMGKALFGMLAVFAEFERDLISLRTREGLEVARAKGRLRGRPPKLSPERERLLVRMVREDTHTRGEVAAIFGVGRSTVARALSRAGF